LTLAPIRRMRSHDLLRLVAAGLVVALAGGCSAAPSQRNIPLGPVDTGPGTLEAARNFLHGEWTLLSLEIFPPDQPSIRAAATGTMTFADYSNMTVDLQLSPETARIADRLDIPTKDGLLQTTGRTVIDINSKSISYVLEGQESFRPPRGPLD